MKSIKINFEMVNCALLFIILILVIICCTNKSEGFSRNFQPNDDNRGGGDSVSKQLSECNAELAEAVEAADAAAEAAEAAAEAAEAAAEAAAERCNDEKATIKQADCGGRLPTRPTDSDEPN
jgi:hypothetical protein